MRLSNSVIRRAPCARSPTARSTLQFCGQRLHTLRTTYHMNTQRHIYQSKRCAPGQNASKVQNRHVPAIVELIVPCKKQLLLYRYVVYRMCPAPCIPPRKQMHQAGPCVTKALPVLIFPGLHEYPCSLKQPLKFGDYTGVLKCMERLQSVNPIHMSRR